MADTVYVWRARCWYEWGSHIFVHWSTSRQKADLQLERMKEFYGKGSTGYVSRVGIPTTQSDLVEWLNAHR